MYEYIIWTLYAFLITLEYQNTIYQTGNQQTEIKEGQTLQKKKDKSTDNDLHWKGKIEQQEPTNTGF